MIKMYKKKPIPVEVIQYTGEPENRSELYIWSNNIVEHDFGSSPIGVKIETLEGTMRPNVGDYVIKGAEGEFWFVKKSIFEKTYEEL